MNNFPSKKVLLFIFILAAAAAIFFVGKIIYRGSTSLDHPANLTRLNLVNSKPNCSYRTEKRTVRGDSLSGLIEPGATVKILFDYYQCRDIERDDVVAYSYAGKADPIIKIAKGLSGDTLSLRAKNDKWLILLNNKIVRNSKSEEYEIDRRGQKMLSLYIKDYKGIIPPEAYLILGNLKNGSLDSTRFGLVGKKDILGKIELVPN